MTVFHLVYKRRNKYVFIKRPCAGNTAVCLSSDELGRHSATEASQATLASVVPVFAVVSVLKVFNKGQFFQANQHVFFSNCYLTELVVLHDVLIISGYY